MEYFLVVSAYRDYEIIYTGISKSSIRKRDYNQHFTGNNAGRSTLRKSLGSMMSLKRIPRDKKPESKKTKFSDTDEIILSKWMADNLILFYTKSLNPDDLDDQLIEKFNPPLNLAKNNNPINTGFRTKLKELRNN